MSRKLWMTAVLAAAAAVPLAAPTVLCPAPEAVAQETEPSLVGQDAPEISTQEWINSDGRTRIADFKGEVVLLEEFATW